jgi:ribosomal protein L37AE/L43A
MRCAQCGEELLPTSADDIYQCPRCATLWQLNAYEGRWVRVGQAVGPDRPLEELFDDE